MLEIGMQERVKDLFSYYDKDSNGTLDSNELNIFFETVLSELDEDKKQLKDTKFFKAFYDHFDVDRNGLIDQSEFMNLMEFLVEEKGYKI